MICISIREQDFEKCKEILTSPTNGNYLFELRADLCGFTPAQIEELISITPNSIITCRSNRAGGSKTEAEALELITTAIKHGARYVDVEIEASLYHLEYIKAYATANSCKLIISYHNYTDTPTLDELCSIRTLCKRKGADIVKIVTTARSTEESMRVLSLYNVKQDNNTPLVAFAMGEAGKFTRKSCLDLGSPFTYCSLNGANTAPGQYSAEQMEKILNADNYPYLFNTRLPDKAAHPAIISIPCSKSISQRAIIASALCNGTTLLSNYAPCNDSEAAISAITALGCSVVRNGEESIKITSPGAYNLCRDTSGDNIELNIGESGLLTRLLLPLSAIISGNTGKSIRINGSGSVMERDLSEAVDILKSCGIKCTYTLNDSGKVTLPVSVESGFFNADGCTRTADRVVLDGSCSSQTISGILMALPLQNRNITVHVNNPASVPYLDLTVEVLKRFSVICKKSEAWAETGAETGDGDGTGTNAVEFAITGKQKYISCSYHLAPDWSSAAYFKVLQTLGANISFTDLPTGTSQADEAITEVCSLCNNGYGDLRAFDFDATDCPDLFPIISILALFCDGTSRIKGVHRLAEKESNRAEAICSELLKTGAKMTICNDCLIVEGNSKRLSGEWNISSPLLFDTHNDHRMAMSLIVLSCKLPVPVRLNNIKCIDKSFPLFIKILNTVLS